MTKYFVKETEEELEFGDVLEIAVTKELEDGCVTCEKEIKFTPETAGMLLEIGIVETVCEEGACEEKGLEEYEEDNFLNIDEKLNELQGRVSLLENTLISLCEVILGKNEETPKKRATKRKIS